MDWKKNATDTYRRQEMGSIEAFHDITDVFHHSSVHLFDYPSNHPNDERTGSCNNCHRTWHAKRIKHFISEPKPTVVSAEWYRPGYAVVVAE